MKGKLTIRKVLLSRLFVGFKVTVKVGSRLLGVSSILYFKIIWIDAMQIITESLNNCSVTKHHLYDGS